MEKYQIVLQILTILVAILDLYFVYSRDLMMLQQNSYRNERYLRWFHQSNESTTINRIVCMFALFVLLVETRLSLIACIVVVLFLSLQALSLSRRKYKKPLVRTKRVNRIFATMIVVTALFTALGWWLIGEGGGYSILVASLWMSPMILLLSNWLLKPVEKHINKKFYDDAASILASMPQLKVVGITGSYGKTSTKHYLHRILSEHFSTTMTPGSFNTTLGVIRTVREYLKPYDEVFIVEMGAKQPGDIKEITELVKPSAAIITAVGEQHLETFKCVENVQKTKFELVDALPADGFAVLNNDFEYVANRKVTNVKALRYAVANVDGVDYKAEDIKYTSRGTTFRIVGGDLKEALELHTALVGECNVSNLLAAVIVALKLGVPVEKIKYAVSQIEQVEHRLSVKRVPGGLTIIDDAFNSNPFGAKMAVEVLGMMKDEGKRIIITPGMIELGERQFDANQEFGKNIAANVDAAVIVGKYNREAILSGIEEGGLSLKNIFVVDSFEEAQQQLQKIAAPGDIVLYENDLPDTFK